MQLPTVSVLYAFMHCSASEVSQNICQLLLNIGIFYNNFFLLVFLDIRTLTLVFLFEIWLVLTLIN